MKITGEHKDLYRGSFRDTPDEKIMRKALCLAQAAGEKGEIPVGAVIADVNGKTIAEGFNKREESKDPTDHAEIIAIRKASQMLKDWRLSGLTLFVTMEPCTMCAGAIVTSRISRVVFGAFNNKTGSVGSRIDILRDEILNTNIEVVSGVLISECEGVLAKFFADLR